MVKHRLLSNGFSYLLLVMVFVIIGVAGIAGWRVYSNNQESSNLISENTKGVDASRAVEKPADSASTIDSPEKISTNDGQYFLYGAPAGQNNASPKRILITVHGTEGSAERDYEVWKPFIANTNYALASLNWWDGSGDTTADYSTPSTVNTQLHNFLDDQGYTKKDVVVFEGFSRGSANSYPVVAFDRTSGNPMIDFVVSSSGGAEASYFNLTTSSISATVKTKVFSGVYWIMACGDKDENPSRDGCQAMESAKSFVTGKGATVLGILSDPNGGHGALTTSSLNLPAQMFELIEARL
jgi:hypothetical protein